MAAPRSRYGSLVDGRLLAQRQVLEGEVSLPAEEKSEKPKEVKERGKNVEIRRYSGFRNGSAPHLQLLGAAPA